MKHSSAAEMFCPINIVLQMQENMFVWFRPQQMSHCEDVSSFSVKIMTKKLSFLLILNHIAITISVKNNCSMFFLTMLCSSRNDSTSEAQTLNKSFMSPSRMYPVAYLLPKSEASAVAGYHYAPTVLFVPNCTLSPCREQIHERNTQRIVHVCVVCHKPFVSVRK